MFIAVAFQDGGAVRIELRTANGLHMLTDIHFDNARMTTNGDIFSSVWG
ncbi:phage tail protein, partial [Salmonella enterica]|nr:phage tail protein [Salmonella enterica]ECI1100007.1 phage tail protein [Salmonella enterica subsp. enterica serovar Javiana]EDY0542968.1 phage tail protein [Salmonella enterica subsp. enterica serovar Panama]ECG9760607.1 phage tail protein [Salmonella enterica]ECP1306329.1 phage tail protein [Salmonella enterica]